MSNSKKVTKNAVDGMAAEVKKGGKKVAGVRGKTLVPSVTTKTPEKVALVDQIAQDFHDAQIPKKPPTKKAAKPKATETKIKNRDPRLPQAGTPIIRKWRNHEVIVTENADGLFKVKLDKVNLGEAKSLTKAAEMALATEGITTGVNGYAWFNVGVPEKTPCADKGQIDALKGRIARMKIRYDGAEGRAYRLNVDINDAIKALIKAQAEAAAEAAAAPAAPESTNT